MRRRWLGGLAAGAVVVAMVPAISGAAPITSATIYQPEGFFRFCAEAQIDLADIDRTKVAAPGADTAPDKVSVSTTIYANSEDFVSSKSAVTSATRTVDLSQYVEYRDAEKTQPRKMRCKMRTGESLNKGNWLPGAENNPGRWEVEPTFGFGSYADALRTVGADDPDRTCQSINDDTLTEVQASIAAAGDTPVNTLTTLSDFDGDAGSLYTTPEGTNAPDPQGDVDFFVRNAGPNAIELRARSLWAPTGTSIQRFRGAHYCDLIAPEYARALILGQETIA